MILGIGIDIVHISRLEKWYDKDDLLRRFFHPDELAEARSRGRAAVGSLAARFAAKEAFGKAMGTGLHNLQLKDIRISSDANGKPDLVLYGSAERQFRKVGGVSAFVSLTHERDNAVAVVILEA